MNHLVTTLSLAFTLALPVFSLGASPACLALFTDQHPPELVAYHNGSNEDLKGEIAKAFISTEESKFEVGRNADQYADTFHNGENEEIVSGYFTSVAYPLSLGKSLLRLNKSSHVMDGGCGMFGALMQMTGPHFAEEAAYVGTDVNRGQTDYAAAAGKFQQEGAPNMTGITMVNFDQDKFIWAPQFRSKKREILANPKIQPFFDRYFEQISNEELTSKFGKVDLFLDLSGVLAYTLNLPLVLEKLAMIMKAGGQIWMRENLVKVQLPDGSIVSLQDYMGHVPGFKRMTPSNAQEPGFLFERTTDQFIKPDLELTSLKTSNPNRTLYRVRK